MEQIQTAVSEVWWPEAWTLHSDQRKQFPCLSMKITNPFFHKSLIDFLRFLVLSRRDILQPPLQRLNWIYFFFWILEGQMFLQSDPTRQITSRIHLSPTQKCEWVDELKILCRRSDGAKRGLSPSPSCHNLAVLTESHTFSFRHTVYAALRRINGADWLF